MAFPTIGLGKASSLPFSSASTPLRPAPETAWYVEATTFFNPNSRASGARVTTICVVEQLALAMRPSWSSRAAAFTSGTTRGTFGSSLKSLPLSMTIAPREMASSASWTAAPFSPSVPAKKAKSTPSKASGSATPTSKVSPARTAARALLARIRNSFIGKSRRLSSAMSLSPTSPAPTIATVYPSGMSVVPPVVLYRPVRDVKQVPDDAARGPFRASSWAAHGEGNIRVAARAEIEDVLGAAYGAEGALHGGVLQADRDRTLLRDADQIAQHMVLLDGKQARRESLVVLGQALHKLLQRDVFEAFGD